MRLINLQKIPNILRFWFIHGWLTVFPIFLTIILILWYKCVLNINLWYGCLRWTCLPVIPTAPLLTGEIEKVEREQLSYSLSLRSDAQNHLFLLSLLFHHYYFISSISWNLDSFSISCSSFPSHFTPLSFFLITHSNIFFLQRHVEFTSPSFLYITCKRLLIYYQGSYIALSFRVRAVWWTEKALRKWNWWPW